ncbi:probable serine/threonine protein kinase IRE4 isoform X2 [Henckelia pumila]|uniref:probable serine/threonine protein kinase IRE4 isoform X2 n=1 Tax=Henckelia pumila TaxID=405737 RepID=UPI003C6E20E4
MAVRDRNGVAEYLPEVGIPTGLNRIKTRRIVPRERVSSGAEDSDHYSESPSAGASFSRTFRKQKPKIVDEGPGKLFHPKQGFGKGRKIARWFTSSLFKDSDQTLGDFPRTKSTSAHNMPDKEMTRRKFPKGQKNSSKKEFSLGKTSAERVPKGLKSFSHELGPTGSIHSVNPRAQSFNDLKELLGSLHSRFDAAKQVVDIELGMFLQEMQEILHKSDFVTLEEYKMAEELSVLAQQCVDMSSIDFRTKCEAIVQDLTEKRLKCEAGPLKVLVTRVLFILTRCTRLLHFDNDDGLVHERSLNKVMECLGRVPSVDKSWVAKKGFVDSDASNVLKLKGDPKRKLQGKAQTGFPSWAIDSSSELPLHEEEPQLGTSYMSVGKNTSPSNLQPNLLSAVNKLHGLDGGSQVNREHDNLLEDSNLVICRICEELVPSMHLEPHSYICAYADKCVSKHLVVDDRLFKLAELLEHLLELRNSSNHETHVNPDILRLQTANFPATSESNSPKFIEWRSKGMDGMLEDLHEMDTACIEDSHLATSVNLKSHLGKLVNQCGPPSSNGSMTSTSSTNSPRTSNFDIFWIDLNNLTEQEDLQQIIDLADIARCVAETDLSDGGSHEFLLDCMQDLQDILQHTKHKALLVDTFGSRIESLLREKYIHACNLVDDVNDVPHPESSRSLLDSTSQSSTTSTPSHRTHKERISIDDFDIIKPISRGAYGKVFLARKRTTGDLFAIKVLKKLDILRKNDIERILAERNILITVRFFYSFTSTDHLYLVMEYLNGGDLYSLLRKIGCLEEVVARTYIAELVLALEYLHSLGIVHRDLKPDNILIAHDGHIKLTDFGLSKIGLMNCTTDLSGPEIKTFEGPEMHGRLNTDSEDSHQSAVGTPDYLAPEILLGTEHGYASDWWSVGIILFEFITGIPPFTADHPEIIFDNILNRKIPWPSVPTEMSFEAQDLIDRLLLHDPNLRLGAKGASEVKAHPFFSGVDWNNLALQKAAFVPQPDSIDDTSYFVSRYNSTGIHDEISLDSTSESSELHSNSGLENMDECGDLAEFNSPLDLSLINFSFKNLSQLASINHDVLLQSWKDSSSPCKGSLISPSS